MKGGTIMNRENKKSLDIINPEDKYYADGNLYNITIGRDMSSPKTSYKVYAQSAQSAVEIVVAHIDMINSNLLYTPEEVLDYIQEDYSDEFINDKNFISHLNKDYYQIFIDNLNGPNYDNISFIDYIKNDEHKILSLIKFGENEEDYRAIIDKVFESIVGLEEKEEIKRKILQNENCKNAKRTRGDRSLFSGADRRRICICIRSGSHHPGNRHHR